MFVRELLKQVCTLCGKSDVANYISGKSAENYPFMLEEEKLLLQAFHTVECELAIEYLPILMEEELESTGFIDLSCLKEQPLAIQKIVDSRNIAQPFTLTCDGIQTAAGVLKIVYSIYPKEKSLSDKIQIPVQYYRVLLLGVAAEYAMLGGQFELFNVFDKKYKDAISYACRTKGGIMKMRRWL